MKNKLLLLHLFLLLFSLTSYSQNQFDTLQIKQIAKGVKYYSVVEPNKPWTLDILKIDLSNPILKLEAGISKDKIVGYEKTSAMSQRYNSDGHHIVGAVNGGFFDGNGQDVGMQIREGEIITQNNNWSAIGFSSENLPFIERLTLNSKILLNDKQTSRSINGINKIRQTNYLIHYNSYFGSNTGTNQYGSEVTIEPLSKIAVNDTTKYIVTGKASNQGSSVLTTGNSVLSGHGTAKDFIDSNVSVGDTIFIVHNISPAPKNVTTLLNGYPKIVSDGENCALSCYAEEGGSNTFATAAHPRTAAGFSEDKQFLYLVTVDGRQESSIGMSLPELADFLVGFGVFRAVNLDGGGSSTMVVRNSIVNSPSDAGGERSVSNSLMVVSLDMIGELSQINLNTEFAKVFSNNNYKFSTTGSDEFFNPKSISSEVEYTLSHSFGTITSDGLFTAGLNADTGYVIAKYQGMIDSALVIVNSIVRLQLTPKVVLADTTNEIYFKVKSYDINGWDRNLSNENFEWISTNDNVGEINEVGKFKGLSEGITKIIVKWANISDTALVNIELNEGSSIINRFDNLNEWSLTGKEIDTSKSSITIIDSIYTEGNTSLKLDYNFTYLTGLQYWAYLNTSIPINGIPINFEMDVNANDYKHTIALIVSNYNGDEFALLTNNSFDLDNQFDTLIVEFKNPIPLGLNNNFHFPITIKSIAVFLNSDRINNVNYSGSIYFDNLRLNYSEPIVSVDIPDKPIRSFLLSQNFPNPFNPTTIIQYSIPRNLNNNGQLVRLVVFDILGREVYTLVSKNQTEGNYSVNFDASKLASGIYYYTLSAGGFSESKKMVLLR